MATSAKMSFNYYQNGKYGTLPQNPTKDMEVTQDMHLKMSKKIAQLTKVIYALNTKNDEHEAVVAGLKEQHEDEMQQLLAETRGKIELYKTKICGEVEYRHRIETLEACMSQYDKQRQDAFIQFEVFKTHAEERESRLKTEHSEKMLSLSQEVLAVKKDFEDQLANFVEQRDQMENDKLRSLEELRTQHLHDIEQLKLSYLSQSSDIESDRAQLEQLHRREIAKFEEQSHLLNSEKSKLVEDYEGKLSKAQAFYENELAVLKNSQNSSFEGELCNMREQQEKMRKDFAFQESQNKQRIDSLIEQLSKSEDEAASYKDMLHQLQAVVDSGNSSTSQLKKQLEVAKEEASSAMTRLREHQAELVASRQMCDQQAQDLLRKSTLIGELEATRLLHQSTIGEFQSEVNRLRDKLSWLEAERNDLESKKMTEAERAGSQLSSLEKALEDISMEKQTMKERYDREIKSLNEKISNREKSLQSDHSDTIEHLKKQHQEEVQHQRQTASEELSQTKQALEKKLEEGTERLSKDREAIQSEFEKIKAELLSKLQSAEEEVRRLETAVKESEHGLGSASSHINSLKEASTRLKQELDNVRGDLKVAKTTSANLKAELEKTKTIYETKLTAAETEVRTRTQQLTADLEKKWTDTLRKETTKLREELSQQKSDEMRAALQQLTKMKDEEMAGARLSWETRLNDLLNQISTLSQKVASAKSSASIDMENLRREMEAEKLKLEQKLKTAEAEYADKIANMDKDLREQLRVLGEQKDREAAEVEASLKYRHMDELQGQITAHKAALDAAQQDSERTRLTEQGELKARHKKEIDKLREDLDVAHSAEMSRQAESHQSQIHAARLELERSIEITKQKEKDHLQQTEELQNEISQRERHIKNLDEEINKLRRQLEYLSREIENKGKEISRIKSEADINLKKLQESLKEQHNSVLNNLASDHLQETQDMLVEFNNAQELLKDKISELDIMLDEAEERYRNRNSRPEDLELIQQLREAVSEREGRMKQLQDEKRYYQMELVNRETNFNKVFNSTPNVGVMNPLAKSKKKGDRAPGKFTSAPSLNAWGSANKLDPLPNSPLHDEKLNPVKPLPLPRFAKKFVK